jgi:PAS domain S-box-containing protein
VLLLKQQVSVAGAATSRPPAAWPHSPNPALQLIYDTAPIGLAFLSPDCRYLYINRHLTEICGISVEDHLGRTVRDCVPALAESVEDIVRSIVATGEPVTGIEVSGQRADQVNERSWITYWHPLFGEDGDVLGVNVAAEEITERKRAEAALRASEQQFRTLAEAIPQLVWMSDAQGRISWANTYASDFVRGDRADLSERDWIECLQPAERDNARRLWTVCVETGATFEMELSLRSKNNRSVPCLTRIVSSRDANGVISRWIGTHVDISERKRREDHIRVISSELSHRTKNLMAVVMAIASQTAKGSANVEEYYRRFSERLNALAYCHDLLVRDNWVGASFDDVVAAQLKPFREGHQGRVSAAGPALVLKPEAVQNLGLAFHELGTNALKHGALSGPQGEVAIRWLVDDATGTIHVTWQESGGPAVVPPRRRGFGYVVINQIVPGALKGNGTVEFAPAGVQWHFEFPAHRAR